MHALREEPEQQTEPHPANDNESTQPIARHRVTGETISTELARCEAWPIVVLHSSGDGRALYQALARVLVRRELIIAGAIPQDDACESPNTAG